MTPIPLRTVRPFVMEEIVLSEIAEDENISLTDKMEINKYLRSRVSRRVSAASLTVIFIHALPSRWNRSSPGPRRNGSSGTKKPSQQEMNPSKPCSRSSGSRWTRRASQK